MTGGVVVVLGPIGANFGAGMTGGRAYLYDPDGRHVAALDARSVTARASRLPSRDREDGAARAAEFRGLVEAHREAGSALAARLLAERTSSSRHLARRAGRRRRRPAAAAEDDASPRRPVPVAAPVRPVPRWASTVIRYASRRSSNRSQPGRSPRRCRRGARLAASRLPARALVPEGPSDDPPHRPRVRRPSAVRDGAWRAGHLCDVWLSPPARHADNDIAWFHFNPLGGRDARGCRVDCADAAHDVTGRASDHPRLA